MNVRTVAVVGNPNCGKTTLFNALTGSRQQVGNWPGVTVDRKTGVFRHQEVQVELVDTPGIYTLSASSLDERITRDFLLSGQADLIVNIIDAANIERNLYLTMQLLEMRVPLLIALNMMDMAAAQRLEIDLDGLARSLGCPVIPLTASKSRGIEDLKDALCGLPAQAIPPAPAVDYPLSVTRAAESLAADLRQRFPAPGIDLHWLAIKLLEGDDQAAAQAALSPESAGRLAAHRKTLEQQEDEEVDIIIASARYRTVSQLTRTLVRRRGKASLTLSDRIDRIVLNRFAGVPLFLLAMYLMFLFTINLGGAFIDFFDQLAGAVAVDGLSHLLAAMHAPEWLITIVAKGIGGGLQTMATFIPPIGFMFLFLSLLEDSGYMARAAFVMDRFMRFIGLPGKAFVPMLVGFGCNVPAIMATRTLENERDRTLTVMMNPFMSCGARLPVYALFAAAFFPVGGQNLVFALYLIGIGFAVLTGLILKNTLLKGEITPFVMEMPPYHLPTVRSVLLRALDRLKSFLFRAGRVLVPVIMVLSFLNSLGTDGSFGNENTEKSALATLSKVITPALEPLGVSQANWPATVGIFTGLFAKEAVVGTLDALYTGIDQQDAEPVAGEQQAAEYDFAGAVAAAFATIPENLAGLVAALTDPLGLSLGDLSDRAIAAEAQKVRVATFGSMVQLFGSQSAAFAYLLFILLYFPCSAAIAAVYRETSLAWTAFAGFWTTFLAYLASTLFYQLANFSVQPGYALLVIAVDLGAFAGVVMVMRSLGAANRHPRATIAVTAPVAPGLVGER